jgi:hypothetical protein
MANRGPRFCIRTRPAANVAVGSSALVEASASHFRCSPNSRHTDASRDANGAPHFPDDSPYRKKFTGKYDYRISKGGIGHNLPQEAPHDFAQAIIDVDKL